MNDDQIIRTMNRVLDGYMHPSMLSLKVEGAPVLPELHLLNLLAEKYLRYKKDLKLFRKMKVL